MESLAQAFTGFSEILDARRREINTRLHTAGWEGDHADQFRAEWNSKHYPILTGLVAALASAAVTLRYEAQQQEWASLGVSSGQTTSATSGSGATPSDLVSQLQTIAAQWGWLAGSIGGSLPLVGGLASQVMSLDSDYRFVQDLQSAHYQAAFTQGTQILTSDAYGIAAQIVATKDPALLPMAGTVFLAGTAVAVVGEVESAVRAVDWSQPPPNPFAPGELAIYGASFDRAVTEVGGNLVNDVAKPAIGAVIGAITGLF